MFINNNLELKQKKDMMTELDCVEHADGYVECTYNTTVCKMYILRI